MNSTIVTLITLLASLVAGLTSNTQIGQVIATLQQIIATGIQEIQAVGPMIKNIIAALQSNKAVTMDQMDQLAALDIATDAAFEAAATAAGEGNG